MRNVPSLNICYFEETRFLLPIILEHFQKLHHKLLENLYFDFLQFHYMYLLFKSYNFMFNWLVCVCVCANNQYTHHVNQSITDSNIVFKPSFFVFGGSNVITPVSDVMATLCLRHGFLWKRQQ